MAVFYGLYFFAFRKFTFHSLNRFYLLSTLCFSFVIPLISFQTTRVVKVEPAILNETVRMASAPLYNPAYTPTYSNNAPIVVKPNEVKRDWRYYLIFTYIAFAIILSAVLLAKLVKIYHLSKKAVKTDNLHIVQSAGQVSNASFFKLIVLNTNGLTDNEKAQIIAHECVHIRQLHSVDILFIEICKIIVWFNPIIYFYKKSLVEVHEFEADLNTIQQFDSKNYAHLLLKLGISYSPDLTNQFSLHPLSTRIQFLFKKQTTTIKKVFYFSGLPLLALGIFAFAQRHEKLIYEAKAKASENINNKIAGLSEALKSIEKNALGDKQEVKSLASSNQTDSVRVPILSFINPFILKTPEIKLPEPNKISGSRNITAVINTQFTPFSYSLDLMKNGKFLTETAKEEDIKVFQNGVQLIQNEDYEFIYEKGIITKIQFKPHIQSSLTGVSIHIKFDNMLPPPKRKQEAIPLPSIFSARVPKNQNSNWRYDNLGVSPKKMSFNVDTLRTLFDANFLGKEPLVIINGREYHPRILQSLNYRSGRSYIAKANNPKAIEKYGVKAQDGVVDINTTDKFDFDSEIERQQTLQNIQRQLIAFDTYRNERIIKVRLFDKENHEFERVIVKGFIDKNHVQLNIPVNGKILYKVDGKIVSEDEISKYEGLFTGSSMWNSEIPDNNGFYAGIDLRTKR